MEAKALFERFHENLDRIAYFLKSGLEVRTMPYQVSMPLEARMVRDILKEKGIDIAITAEGYNAFFQLKEQYEYNQAAIQEAFKQILEDKHAYMRTPEGRVLMKETLIRRMEYFAETAHTLDVMKTQRDLKSPIHHQYPYLT